jgi:hypothetical protein
MERVMAMAISVASGRNLRRGGLHAFLVVCMACGVAGVATAQVDDAAEMASDGGHLVEDDEVMAEATADLERVDGELMESESMEAAATEPDTDVTDPMTDPTAPLPPPDSGPYAELEMPDEGWRYETSYFFMLTCGLREEPIKRWVRNVSMAGTVPLDIFTLPGAALAGLFGP